MTTRIAPDVAPRLEFFVVDSNGSPVPSLTRTDFSAFSYILITEGLAAAGVTVTPSSNVAWTAAKASGQFVTINSALGHYAVDCPAGAASSSSTHVIISATPSVATQVVRSVKHEIESRYTTPVAGGDATLANQTTILSNQTTLLANQVLILADEDVIIDKIDALTTTQLAVITVESGVISNFPETLTIGDSYTSNTGQIKINIIDADSDPVFSLGSLDFADADVSFVMFRPGDSVILSGTCTYVATLTESYVLISITPDITALGKAEYTYEGRLKFYWPGPSSADESDDEQKTYKTTPFKFIANP